MACETETAALNAANTILNSLNASLAFQQLQHQGLVNKWAGRGFGYPYGPAPTPHNHPEWVSEYQTDGYSFGAYNMNVQQLTAQIAAATAVQVAAATALTVCVMQFAP